MPHIIVEYSENLAQRTDIAALLANVHAAAIKSGLAPLDALRTRGEPRAQYVIADGHPDNAFVAVVARLGPGRTPEEKHDLLALLLTAVKTSVGEVVAKDVMFSVEFLEIDATFRINDNELRKTISERTTSS